jgi:hypothetical protein
MLQKTVDSKGRVCIGVEYAGRTVLLDDSDPHAICILPAVVVPEREQWLYDHPEALASVLRGMEQAKAGQFAAPKNFSETE